MTSCSLAVRGGRDPALRRRVPSMPDRSRCVLLVGATLRAGCFELRQHGAFVIVRMAGPVMLLALRGEPLPGSIGWLSVRFGWWWIVCALASVLVAAIGPGLPQRPEAAGRLPRRLRPG